MIHNSHKAIQKLSLVSVWKKYKLRGTYLWKWGHEREVSVRKGEKKVFCQKIMFSNSFILAKIHSKNHSSLHSKALLHEFIKISALKQFFFILSYSISECSSQPHSTFTHVVWKFYWKHGTVTLRWWTHSITCLQRDKQYFPEINVLASVTSQMEWVGLAGMETGWKDWQSFP